MTDRPDTVDGGMPWEPSRRDLLRYLAYGTAGAFTLPLLSACTSDDATPSAASKAAKRRRVLVVVELAGGNDGLSTLVPTGDGHYHDLRPTLALGGDDVIDVIDGVGVNAKLARTLAHGPAFLSGVGSMHPSLSHFEMLDRWWRGRPEALTPAEQSKLSTGFLGRLCDALHGSESFTGMTLAFGNLPGLRSAKAATTGLPQDRRSSLTGAGELGTAMRAALIRFAADRSGDVPRPSAALGIEQMLLMDDLIGDLPAPSTGYPDSEFATRLAIASRLIRSDAGVRVIHVPMGGGLFDTHQDHGTIHPRLLAELDGGLHAFLTDLEHHGLDRDVLVATTSEFGRRPEEHDGGLDHGTASTMMLLGPVVNGRHGDPSSLVKLDDTDNLVATVAFDRYYATLAEWMHVDPAQVLAPAGGGAAPKPIAGVVAT